MIRLKFLFFFVTCVLTHAAVLRAQTDSTLRFVYVLQNPKYYGATEAKSWFEIEGLENKTVQDKINQSLKKAFHTNTGFETTETGFGTTQQDTTPPQGFTDYIYFNGNTYGNGWVRFKNSDSLLRLTQADGYYGSGKNIEGFYSCIAPGKIANIAIQAMDSEFSGEYNVIELTFSLGDGRVLPSAYPVAINPVLKDSLTRLLDSHALSALRRPGGTLLNCTLIPNQPVHDSCIVTTRAYIYWLNRETSGGPAIFGRSYSLECDLSETVPASVSTGLYLNLMIPFFSASDWQQLQDTYR